MEHYKKVTEPNYYFFLAAKASLGRLYKEGFGVERNLEEAVALIQSSADKNSGFFDVASGFFSFFGHKDSASNSYASGLYELALLCRDGEGVNPDDQKAVSLLEKAVAQKHNDAFYTLGWMIEQGRGIGKNPERAQFYYSEEIQRHAEDALYSIGRMYEQGLRVEVNKLEAQKWYQKAADLGYEPAIDKLKTF